MKDAIRVSQLKPGPRLEAAAYWYAANAKSQSAFSTSPTFTAAKKQEYRKAAIDDVRKAIDLAPNRSNELLMASRPAQNGLGIEAQLTPGDCQGGCT